jgi:hypothetical protein
MQFRTNIAFWGDTDNCMYFCLYFTGVSIDKVTQLSQETRNYVGCKLLELTITELFVFRFMQACVNVHIFCSYDILCMHVKYHQIILIFV